MTPCARRKVIIAPTVLWLIFIWMEMASYDVDICSLSFLLTAHRRHPGSRTRSCYVCSRPRSFTVWIREFVQLSPGVGLLGSFCSCPHTQGCTRHLVGVLFERTLVMTSEGRRGPRSHGTCWREGGDRGSRLEPRAPAALRER